MMFVLDTCLVSEFTRKELNPGVVAWMGQQLDSDLWITTLTLGELAKGIERLPLGKKRSDLQVWLANDLLLRFQGRILVFDVLASFEWGRLCARLEIAGQMMPAVDSQIAAICLVHGASIVTRNHADFANSGVQVVNPWTQS